MTELSRLRKAWYGPAIVAVAVLSCAKDSELASMLKAEERGDAAGAHDIALHLANAGRANERLAAMRLLARQKDSAAVVKAADGIERMMDSRTQFTELLEVEVPALVAVGEQEKATAIARDAVGKAPEDPRRHLVLAHGLIHASPCQALVEVREALLLLPSNDRVLGVKDQDGHYTSDRFYDDAMAMYGLLWKQCEHNSAERPHEAPKGAAERSSDGGSD